MNVRNFLTKEEEIQLVNSIIAAETITTGEIRVHLENNCKQDVLSRAAKVFNGLGMQNTENKTGVLIYVAVKDHKMAIIGDSGIHEKVPECFWEDIIEQMKTDFKAENHFLGLKTAIKTVGEQLSHHFPFSIADTNELPNNLSYGDA